MLRIVVTVSASVSLLLQGCASTYSSLASVDSPCPASMGADPRLQCALREVEGDGERDTEFRHEMRTIGQDLQAGRIDEAEANRRFDLVLSRFEAQEAQANQRNAALAIAGIAAVGVAAAAADSSSGSAPYSSYSSSRDYSWAWDRFVGPTGRYQWRCRGEQTGRFADDYRCAGRIRTDTRWPG